MTNLNSNAKLQTFLVPSKYFSKKAFFKYDFRLFVAVSFGCLLYLLNKRLANVDTFEHMKFANIDTITHKKFANIDILFPNTCILNDLFVPLHIFQQP